jgi:CubicO group peptidase (beta-lactamase class C family)
LSGQYVSAAEPELAYPSDGYYGLELLQMPQEWGLSFMISPSVTGRSDSTAHWSGISNVFWWCDREKRVAAIVASQTLPFPDPGAGKLWAQVEAAVYEKSGKL